MADQEIEIKLKVNSDTGQLEVAGQKFNDLTQKTEKLETSFLSLDKANVELLKSLSKLATGAAVVKFFSDSIKEAEEENEVLRRLKFNIEAAGQSFEENKKKVDDWAAAIQTSTRFSDTQALTSLERFVRVTNDLSSAQQAAQLAMGLSVASGKDLATVEALIADLLNGNTRALVTLNKEFGGFIGNATNAQDVLDRLSEKFNNAAFAEDSFTRKSAELKNQFSDFQETVGNAAIPVLELLFKALKEIVSQTEKAGSALAFLVASVLNPDQIKSFYQTWKEQINEIDTRQKQSTLNLKLETNERLLINSSAAQEETSKNLQELRSQQKNHDAHVKLYYENEKKKQESVRKLEEEALKLFQKTQEERNKAIRQSFSDTVQNLREFGKISQEAFEVYKALAIAETIMSTYEGAQRAFTALAGIPIVGPALGTAAAGAAVGAGLARVAIIQGTQRPSYHTGGVVSGSGDVPINAQGGEFIVNRSAAQKNKPLLNAINNGAGVSGIAGSPSVVNVSISTNTLDLSSIDVVLKKISEELTRASPEAIRFSRLSSDLAERNSFKAV